MAVISNSLIWVFNLNLGVILKRPINRTVFAQSATRHDSSTWRMELCTDTARETSPAWDQTNCLSVLAFIFLCPLPAQLLQQIHQLQLPIRRETGRNLLVRRKTSHLLNFFGDLYRKASLSEYQNRRGSPAPGNWPTYCAKSQQLQQHLAIGSHCFSGPNSF